MTLTRTLRTALTPLLLSLALAGACHAQDVKEIIPKAQAIILDGVSTPYLGAEHPDVTIVEWFDYNCPFCRREAPNLIRLVSQDHKVRLVYKDWPVLGPMSVAAAHAAQAANWQGKYLAAHNALLGTPTRLTSDDQIRDALKSAGIDLARLDRDMVAHKSDIDAILARNNGEAERMGLQGTPGLLIGRQMVFGGLAYPQLVQLVTRALSGG
ncbi:MAG: DsbA family protein [Caulobacteraceae bacterium]